MWVLNKFPEQLFQRFLSEKTRRVAERVILRIALISFFIHLAIIYLISWGVFVYPNASSLLLNPIAAIYTPFSFILIYEVYLLIYYLPKSITTYISKQYEIITLIVIRRLFKDLASLELSANWFQNQADLQFTYDLIASLVLFYLIYLFQVQGSKKTKQKNSSSNQIQLFVQTKKWIALILVPLFFFISVYTLITWSIGFFISEFQEVSVLKSINDLFFDQFFTILILVDVILLLLSFFYTDKFHKIIRNSGFVLSTILIRISFGLEGFLNTILIVISVLIGLIIIYIHNKYEFKSKEE